MSGPRVLVAGLYHETHTFLRGTTPLADVRTRRRAELLDAVGDASALGGVLEFGRSAGWDIVPAVDMSATPGPTVADEVVDTFVSEVRHAVADAGNLDGIYLALHGAMVSETCRDVEGRVLEAIRRMPGVDRVPLCGVLDLHANVTEAMSRHSDGLIGYRCNPHTDAREAAVDAARLLDDLLRTGRRCVTVWEAAPIIWPPSGVATSEPPMALLEARARELERTTPGVVAISVFAGFCFADTPDAGVTFTAVTHGDMAGARAALADLRRLAWQLRDDGARVGMDLMEAMGRLAACPAGPVLLVEPADNVGGGAPGDLTIVLRAMVKAAVQDGAACIADAEAVRALSDEPVGAIVTLPIGGNSGEIGAEPIVLPIEVVSRSDGRFRLEDPQSHMAAMQGSDVDMGPCLVVRHAGVRILLTSRKTPPFDLGMWRSQGIAPEGLRVIGVKAAVAHRRAYDPITAASFTVDTPGPCAENLRRLPYRVRRRPVYPLDDFAPQED